MAGEKTLQTYADRLPAGAQRGELADAHARLLSAAEHAIITRAIEQAQGNQAKAARWLGISCLTLRAKLIQFGLRQANEPTL